MARFAVIRQLDNLVTNVVEVAPGSGYTPGVGYVLVLSPTASPGGTYNPATGTFTPPSPVPSDLDRARLRELRDKPVLTTPELTEMIRLLYDLITTGRL